MQVDFYFDYTSPYSYLAHSQLDQLMHWGAQVNLKPVFLGGILSTLGSTPPFRQGGQARIPYILRDLERWAELYGVPMKFNPHFPVNSLALLRVSPYVQAHERMNAWMSRCFKAVWEEELNVAEEAVVRQLAEEVGLDPSALWAAAGAPENKAWLKGATDAAIERGVFGVPTFFVGEEQFFGNDRILFVNRLLGDLAHRAEQDRLRGE